MNMAAGRSSIIGVRFVPDPVEKLKNAYRKMGTGLRGTCLKSRTTFN